MLSLKDTHLKTRAESNDTLSSLSAKQSSCDDSADYSPVIEFVQKSKKMDPKVDGPKKQVKKKTKQTDKAGARREHVEKRSYFRTMKDFYGERAQKAGKGLDCDDFVRNLKSLMAEEMKLDLIFNKTEFRNLANKIVAKMIVLTHTNNWPSIKEGKATVNQNKVLKKAQALAGEELDFERPRRVMYQWSREAQKEFLADPINNFFFLHFLKSDGFGPAMRGSVQRRSQGSEPVVEEKLAGILEHKDAQLQQAVDALNEMAQSKEKTDTQKLASLFNEILKVKL